MSRIDAKIAIPVADTVRPQAHAEDQQAQPQAALAREAVSPTAPPADPPKADDLRAAAEQVRQVIEAASGRQLSFDVDDSGETLLFKITGSQGETIRQIPSQEVLDLRQRINALVGTLIDQKA